MSKEEKCSKDHRVVTSIVMNVKQKRTVTINNGRYEWSIRPRRNRKEFNFFSRGEHRQSFLSYVCSFISIRDSP
jgi:hypothetical protein